MHPATLIASKATVKPKRNIHDELNNLVDTVTRRYRPVKDQKIMSSDGDGAENDPDLADLESVKTPGEVSISVELKN